MSLSNQYIKHVQMRDVCMHVFSDDTKAVEPFHNLSGCWINRLGTFEHPRPFPIGNSGGLAIESLKIPKTEFITSWIASTKIEGLTK